MAQEAQGWGGRGERGAVTAERGFQEPCERKWLLNALRGTRGQERRGEAGEVSRWRSVRAGRREGAGAEDMKPQRPSEPGSEAVRPRVRRRWRRAGKEAGYPPPEPRVRNQGGRRPLPLVR